MCAWEKILYKFNPLDYPPATKLFVKHLYQYAKGHEMDSNEKLGAAFSHVKNSLNAAINVKIRQFHMDLKREFFNFRQFLEYPGIRLSDDKKRAIAIEAYFRDLEVIGGEECWLFRRFCLIGINFYKEMRYIVVQTEAGGDGPEVGEQGCYYIYGCNSDVGEEIMDVWDYNPEQL